MSRRLSLRSIEAFVAVIEAGSIAAGAKRLGASPSSVSQQLSNLEESLDAELLDRGARPLALTPAGYMFQRRALKILDEADEARTELLELGAAAPPRLRLAMIDDLDATLTPDVVSELARQYPSSSFAVRSGLSLDHVASLMARDSDIAIAADPDDPMEGLERHPLIREPFILVAHKTLMGGRGDLVARLMTAPMSRYSNRSLIGRHVERHLRRLRLAPPQRFEFDSSASIFAMIRDAEGWALTTPLGWLDGQSAFGDDLQVAPLPFSGASRTISLYARAGVLRELPARIAALCRERIAARCMAPADAAMPWLDGAMRIEGDDAPPSLRAVES